MYASLVATVVLCKHWYIFWFVQGKPGWYRL